MKGNILLLLIFLFFIPSINALSIKELAQRYDFETSSPQIGIINYSDFMIDNNGNGINDTLIFELTANNTEGAFVFDVSLMGKNGLITNEVAEKLSQGINKVNVTFDSIFLGQNQFSYSIKIYNSSHSLKYRKDNLQTQNYTAYEEVFKIVGIADSKLDNALNIDVELNSSANGTFEASLFLSYNNSIIYAKEHKNITNSLQHLIFDFDKEAIKKTHFVGNYNVSTLKIGKKIIPINFITSSYDFRDFAATSYLNSFEDYALDKNSNNKYDALQIKAGVQILKDGNYTMKLAMYDLDDNLVVVKNTSALLKEGHGNISLEVNGSRMYLRKLNGPYVVKFAELFENGAMVDRINKPYTTKSYNYDDFDKPDLPDIEADISVSDGYHYGINNLTINFTFSNKGGKYAFNVFAEIFDNKTFFKSYKLNTLEANSQISYQINFTEISDTEIGAIADFQDFVEEYNEGNNVVKKVIKLNNHPKLMPIDNLTVYELTRITVNLSATDMDDDRLIFSINSSKFLNNSNAFIWNTSKTDSGNYVLNVTVSDGFLIDSEIFKITVLNIPENDMDYDGIDDSVDKLIGNKDFINTSTLNLTIFVGNTSNMSRLFNKTYHVKFIDYNVTIAEFDFDFLRYRLNLTNLTINKQMPSQKGSLLLKGLKMPRGKTKIMYVDRINMSTNKVCIKDEQITEITNISKNCRSKNEFKITCNGWTSNSYKCTYNSTSRKFQVKGLKHSGVVQTG